MSVECWEAGEQVGSFNPLVAGEGRAFLQRNETLVFMACYLHTGSRNDSAPGLPLPLGSLYWLSPYRQPGDQDRGVR